MLDNINMKFFSNDFSLEKINEFVIENKGKVIYNELKGQNFVFQKDNTYIFCSYLENNKILNMEIGGNNEEESEIYLKEIIKEIIKSFKEIIIFSSISIIFDYYYLQKKQYLFNYAFSLNYNYAIMGFYIKSKEHCKFLVDECSKNMIVDNSVCFELNESVNDDRGNVLKKIKKYNFNGFYLQINLENFYHDDFKKISELILKYNIDQISISIDYKVEKQDYDIILKGNIFPRTSRSAKSPDFEV